MELNQIKDYLVLSSKEFQSKHQMDTKEFINKIREVRNLSFLENHIPRAHLLTMSEADDRKAEAKKIEEVLEKKQFSEQYIKSYIETLTKGVDMGKLTTGALKEILSLFRYRGRKLSKKALRQPLDLDHLRLINTDKDTKKFVLDLTNDLKGMDVMSSYGLGLNSILEMLETSTRRKRLTLEDLDEGELLGIIDPKLTSNRKRFYKEWKKVHNSYYPLKEAIHDVLQNWEKIEPESEKIIGEGGIGIKGLKDMSRYAKEFDKELKELEDIYQKMTPQMNYVIKTKSVYYPVASDEDEESSINVQNLILEKIKDIFEESFDERGGEEVEEEFEIDEPDAVNWEYSDTTSDSAWEKPQPKGMLPDFGPAKGGIEAFGQRIERIERIGEVDPLYAIAAEKGLIKEKFNRKGFIKFTNFLEEEIKEHDELDKGVADQLKEILNEHKRREKEIAEVDMNWYYLPYVEEVWKFYAKGGGRKEKELPEYDTMTEFHRRILKVVTDLIQDPLDKTVMPEVWETSDMPVGGAASRGEQSVPRGQDHLFNLISRFRLGSEGSMRDLGEFADSVNVLIQKIHDYYVNPSHDAYMPFKSKPQYLDTHELSPFMAKGAPNEMLSNLFVLYLSHGIGMISKNDLIQINAYREGLTTSNPTAKHLINVTESILDVIDDFTTNIDVDLRYFAHILSRIARKNSKIDIDSMRLNGRSIRNLSDEYDKKEVPFYKYLIRLIASKERFFKKDRHKRKQIDKFMSLHTSKGDKIMLSEVEQNVLQTHDEIRKMQNKHIYMNYCDTDNYDHVNDTIDLMLKEYNTHLTATDVIGIVNEFDSMNSVAKKFGTKEDVVYHIKALFR